MKRIYLDFDGVVAPLKAPETNCMVLPMPYTGAAHVPLDVIYFLRKFEGEIIWISHRAEDTKVFTDHVGLPEYEHLEFDDPTGSKVAAIWKHLEDNPLPDAEDAVVVDDELTEEEIQDLTVVVPVYVPRGDYGLDVQDFRLKVLGEEG